MSDARKPRAFTISSQGTSAKGKKSGSTSASKSTSRKARKPKVIDKGIQIEFQHESAVDPAYEALENLEPPPPPKMKKRFSWSKLAIGAIMTLLTLMAGLAIEGFIRDLFARNDWLGWTAVGLVAIAAIALFFILVREFIAIRRLNKVEKLRFQHEDAIAKNNLKTTRNFISTLETFYADDPKTAHGRDELGGHMETIMDSSDLLKLAEQQLMRPLDEKAKSLVMGASKRVSIVTAVSPRAIVDIGYVLFENIRLIRKLCEHYGGRPGFFSSWRLTKHVLTHLAATGAIAVGDGLLQQFIGQGLASRLSAKLGEGVVNGLLTARIGIAAMEVCRPMKFAEDQRPGVTDFLSELTKFRKLADEKDKTG